MSPLRQRMIDAMTVRGLSVRTIECYTESISRLSRHYGGVNPARLTPEQIEAYLLHLVKDRKLSYSSVNHVASACRFLFETVLGRPTEVRHLRPPMAKAAQKQPERYRLNTPIAVPRATIRRPGAAAGCQSAGRIRLRVPALRRARCPPGR